MKTGAPHLTPEAGTGGEDACLEVRRINPLLNLNWKGVTL